MITNHPILGTNKTKQLSEFSLGRLQILIDSLKDVVCAIDKNNTFVFVSKGSNRVFGYEPQEMIGKSFTDFLVQIDIKKTTDFFSGLMGGEESGNFINHFYHQNRNILTVLWSGKWDSKDGLIYCIAQDVTEKIKTDKIITKTEEDVNTVLEKMKDGFMMLDKFSNITYWNLQAEKLLGKSKEEVLQKNIWDCFPNALETEFFTNFYKSIQKNEVLFFETNSIVKDAILELTLYPSDSGLSIFFRDITEAKLKLKRINEAKEARQKNVTAAVLRTQESERSSIGRMLHDGVNQVLTTIKLYNEMCIAEKGDYKELLKKSNQMLVSTINEVRDLSKKLSAPTLGDIEAADSINELVNNFTKSSELDITTNTEDIEGIEITQDLHLAMYRIIQEHINNIIEFGNAETAHITIRRTNKTLSLMIVDDGNGFDAAIQNKSIDIDNMIGRAESLDGLLRLISLPGNGSTLLVTFPFKLDELPEKDIDY